jgi:hypothetical protein
MIDGHGGDCGGGDFCASGGGGGDGTAIDTGNPRQPNPIDERMKINGAPVIDQTHEVVITKNNADD